MNFACCSETPAWFCKGTASCHYVKQLAQHLVVQATHIPLLANDIKVLQRSHPNCDLKSRGFKGNVGHG